MAKEFRKIMQLKYNESKQRNIIAKKLIITEQILNQTKKHYKELKEVLKKEIEENSKLEPELNELRNMNDELTKKTIEDKKSYNKSVVLQSNILMKRNNSDIQAVLFQKKINDKYKEEVIKCDKHLRINSKNLGYFCRSMELKAINTDKNIIRIKNNIKEYRKKIWNEKKINKSELKLYKMLFMEKSMSCDIKKDDLKLPEIAKRNEDLLPFVSSFHLSN